MKITQPPFRSDGTYVGDETVRQVEIDPGVLQETNHTGDEAIGEAIKALNALIGELEGGSQERITESLAGLTAAAQQGLIAQTEIGIRLGQLQDVQNQHARMSLNLKTRQSELSDADPSESLTRLMANQQALERAYAVIGRVASMSIIDYL